MSGTSPKVAAALSLHFFSVAAIVLCRTFIDLLFLTTYPRAWLPYLFFGQTGVVLVLAFSIKPVVARGSVWLNASVTGALGLIVAASFWLVERQLPGLPFGLCLGLSGAAVLVGVLSWSAVGDAFDVRQFKRMAKWVNAAGSVGALILGTLIPLLIRLLGADALLLVLGGVLLVQAACLLLLRPLESSGGGKQAGAARSPLGYALFRQLAIGVCLLLLFETFGDWALKSELAAAYSKEGIGSFMGPFYGIGSALTLVVQLFVSDLLLRAFGVGGLLAPLPLLGAAASGAMAVHPGIWTASALRMVQNVAGYSVENLGREIAARPLPGPVRRSGKVYLKGIATPVGKGVGALVIWLAAAQLGLRGVAIVTVVICLGWLLLVTRTSRAYQETLQEAVGSGRLSLEPDELDEHTQQAGQNVALHAIRSDDPDAVIFGLGLLEQMGQGPMPKAALRLLESGNGAVRAAAAKAAGSFVPASVTPALLAQLEREQDPLVTWRLLEVLAEVMPDAAVGAARRLIDHPQPDVRAGSVLVLLEAGDLDGLIRAAVELRAMVSAEDSAMRRGAAHAIGALRAGKLEQELRHLLADSEPEVRVAAIRAAGERCSEGLAREVAAQLGWGRASYFAGRSLIAMGQAAVPALLDVVQAGDLAPSRAAVRTLARIPGPVPDRALMGLADAVDLGIRTVASREVAHRARRCEASDELRRHVRPLVQAAADDVLNLGRVAGAEGLSSDLRVELLERQRLAKERMLNWLAVATDPKRVLDLIPTVTSRHVHGSAASRRAAAIELLDTLVDRELRPTLSALEHRRDDSVGTVDLNQIKDPWFQWLLGAARAEDGAMNIAQRVMLLRKVNLFATLPGETLVTIAENCEPREMVAGQRIFAEGDAPDGMYVVSSGSVKIIMGGKTMAHKAPSEFFGEVALLDDEPRMGDAVAAADGVYLFMDREVYQQLTEDLPEVLREVIRTLIQYLKQNEAATGTRTMF